MAAKRVSITILIFLLAATMVLAIALPVMASGEPETEEESSPVTEPTAEPALSRYRWINRWGFGNLQNRYAWSMVDFKDKIFVGTWNLRVFLNPLDLLWFIDPDLLEPNLTAGTEVWRYDKGLFGRKWTKVVDDGLGDRHNMGLRKMIVWDNPEDPNGEAIYGTTINVYRGLEVWRSYDGVNWEIVVGRGLEADAHEDTYGNGFDTGNDNISGRGMIVFPDQDGEERLYLGAMRSNGGEIWRTKVYEEWVDGDQPGIKIPTWEKVVDVVTLEGEPGPGETYRAVADMCSFDDDGDGEESLFVGSWKGGGFSIYKSGNGEDFEIVAQDGISSPNNVGVHELIVFQDRLWVLTVNILEGFDVYASIPVDPEAGITSNMDWELITTKGFTDRLNSYAWNAELYDNGSGERLYIGTFNLFKGFSLYSITADEQWAVEVGPGSSVRCGIWTPFNYGVRTLEVWEDKLIIGCAGMFKPVEVWAAW